MSCSFWREPNSLDEQIEGLWGRLARSMGAAPYSRIDPQLFRQTVVYELTDLICWKMAQKGAAQ